MSELPFRLDLVQFLVEHRNPYLTLFFQSFTFLGSLEGYILVIALVYAAYDKKLAVRLAVVTLLTMSVNHILKTLIRNPRRVTYLMYSCRAISQTRFTFAAFRRAP